MRLTRLTNFHGLTLLTASAFILSACGGGEDTASDTTDGMAQPGAAAQQPGAAGAGGAATAQQATGQTHTVRMLGDAQGYRFDPVNITVRRGDAVKWVMVSGAPHNVQFDPSGIPGGSQAQLSANMPNQQGPLSSPMMMNANEEYTVSFAGVPTGAYNYVCTPHLAMNMKGVVTVQ